MTNPAHFCFSVLTVLLSGVLGAFQDAFFPSLGSTNYLLHHMPDVYFVVFQIPMSNLYDNSSTISFEK